MIFNFLFFVGCLLNNVFFKRILYHVFVAIISRLDSVRLRRRSPFTKPYIPLRRCEHPLFAVWSSGWLGVSAIGSAVSLAFPTNCCSPPSPHFSLCPPPDWPLVYHPYSAIRTRWSAASDLWNRRNPAERFWIARGSCEIFPLR